MSNIPEKIDPLVLVADDDPAIRLLAQEALEQAGFTVKGAVNGTETLALFQEEQPEIILLDVMMPELNGFEVCTKIRNLPEGKFTPILFMTGLDDIQSIVRAYEVGGTDFITKPWNGLILAHRVRNIFRANQLFKDLQKGQANLAQAQRIAHMGSWHLEVGSNFFSCSEEVFRIIGLNSSEFGGTYDAMLSLIHPDDKEHFEESIVRTVAICCPLKIEHRIIRPDGTERYVLTQGEVVTNKEGKVENVIGTTQDITERKFVETQIHLLAYYDRLTQLPNRRLFHDRLAQVLATAERYKERGAILNIDLDGFHRINESFGHRFGDIILQQAAARLEHCVRKSDTLAREQEEGMGTELSRSGGDEFLITLIRTPTDQIVNHVVQRIISTMAKPFIVDKHHLALTVSIGASLFPGDTTDRDTLIQNAALALTHAKESGGNCAQFFTDSMNQTVIERMSLETHMRQAIEHDQFLLVYQPQYNITTGEVIGAEALLRWQHPEKGLLTPGSFITLAEETGLIISIGEWVYQKAFSQWKEWHTAGITLPRISINLSGLQFRQPNLIEAITDALETSGADPHGLEWELTEGIVMKHAKETIDTLVKLKEIGFSLALDDFGTGYSSLSYLQRFPIDTIKIDRSFIINVDTDPEDAAIITAIIGIAKALRLDILAEGVETKQQESFLQSAGCQYAQGFLYSRPLFTDSFISFLQTHTVIPPIPTR